MIWHGVRGRLIRGNDIELLTRKRETKHIIFYEIIKLNKMKHFSLPKDGGLIEENLPKSILHSYEKITTEIYDDANIGSDRWQTLLSKPSKTTKGRLFRVLSNSV